VTKNRVNESQIVNDGQIRSFMAEECRYTVTHSRYGNHEASTRISMLRSMRAFGHSGKHYRKNTGFFTTHHKFYYLTATVNTELKNRLEKELMELKTQIVENDQRSKTLQSDAKSLQEMEKRLREQKVCDADHAKPYASSIHHVCEQ
jgi:hypothetical protein